MALLRSRNSHRPARSAAWPATVGSIAAIAFLAAAGGGADMGPLEGARVRWSRQFANPVGHPMPLRGENGVEGIVVTLGDGSVTLVDAGGKARWRAKLDLPADAGAVCGTLRPGSNPCVVATDVWASVYCFDSKGKRMWKLARASRSGGFRTPSIVDLDGDGTREVVVSDSRGRLLVIGANGKVRMEVTAGNYRVSGPTIASGRHLIFATDAGDVYRLTPAGDLIWACRPGARYGRSLPVLLGGKSGEVALLPCSFVSDKPGLAMLDAATGAFLMRAPSEVQSYQSTVVADLNADGHPTVLYGDKNSQLYCLDARGQRLWATRLPGRGIFHAPAALASGSRSMILQTVRGEGPDGRCLYALDGHGRVMDGLALKGGGGSCPLVCRFSGETGLSLVTLSASGVLERRDLPPPWSSAGVLWAGPPEGRPGRSALPDAGETPALRSPTPSRRRAVLGANSLEATVPAGAVYASVRVVHPDARSVTILRLPASGGARTTVPVRIPSVGRYEVDVKWLDNRSRSVGAHARYVMVLDDGLTRDAEHQASFERAMQQAMEAMPARSPLISRLLYACRGIYATARAERSGEAFDGLRTERDRCLALVSLMRRAPTASDLVAVPIANPWGRTDAARTLREGKSLNSIAIEMVGNERESRAVLLANLTARAMTVRVERGPFGSSTKPPSAQPGDSLLKLHEAIAVTPTTTGMPVEDALPELGPASTLRLGPGESRTLWMTVSSAQLAEGKHTGTLRIGDVASLKPPTEVRVTVRVSRVRLPDRLRYRHCNWLYLSGMRDETTLERVLQDALGHGTSVFVIPPPTVRLDGAGRALSVEGAQHDWLARRLLGRAALLI
ncbi:MAG: hypothetical protein FJX72_15245, partial [Armatimonadetes bacterium]|nr:hypothetical protein [Armatimonadota bacterium]